MNRFDLKADWNQIKGGLRQRYGILTDDDVAFVEGKGEELLGRLQEKLGIGADELNDVLEELKDSSNGMRGKIAGAKVRATEAYDDAKQKAGHYMDEAKTVASQKADQMMTEAKTRVRTLHEDVEEQVRLKPRQSLLTALAAGFVLGLMLRR